MSLSKRSRNKNNRHSSKSRSHSRDFKELTDYGKPKVRIIPPSEYKKHPVPEQSHEVELIEEATQSLCLKFVKPYDYSDKTFYFFVHKIFSLKQGLQVFCLNKEVLEKFSAENMTVKIERSNRNKKSEYKLTFEADANAKNKALGALLQDEAKKFEIKKKTKEEISNLMTQSQ